VESKFTIVWILCPFFIYKKKNRLMQKIRILLEYKVIEV